MTCCSDALASWKAASAAALCPVTGAGVAFSTSGGVGVGVWFFGSGSWQINFKDYLKCFKRI